ncbi:heavy-metal-associated domain-containing protein [Oceanobacillus massiliensis]|uniref:heavy-metal-associated domain-containing protein n=1 Tax=Oceanobacillus massiliensis TaxID=1465765 RepID=UPI0002889A4B|nr:heavy metal-associated domain-containing protein [Oceanobacillus massiliensis]
MDESVYLDIKGMHCPNCPAKIERSVSKLAGVTHIKVNYEDGNGNVTFNNSLTEITEIIRRINKMGFEAEKAHVY